MLMNVTIVGILTFMCMINLMLNLVEHKKYNLGARFSEMELNFH